MTVSDEDGGSTTVAQTISPANVAPTLTLTGSSTVNEGSPYTLTLGAVHDPGTDTVTRYVVEWGDETSETFTSAGAKTHVYADDDFCPVIRVHVEDEDGTHPNAGTLGLAVLNVAPVVSAGDDRVAYEGDVVTFTGEFLDPGLLDTHTIEWNFGDGATLSGTLTPSHTYTDNGTYTVTLTVTDDNGGIGSDTLEVTVHAIVHVEFSAATSSDNEAAGLHDVLVRLVADPGATLAAPFTVNVADMLSGTAASGHDYTAFGTQSVTFAAGSVNGDTQRVTLAIRNDLLLEGAESVDLQLVSVSGPGVLLGATTAHQVTIVDDEHVHVEFSTAASSADEAAGPHNVLVRLVADPGVTLAVPVTADVIDLKRERLRAGVTTPHLARRP